MSHLLGSITGSNAQAKAAKNATAAQNAALDKANAFEQQQYAQSRADLSPYTALGGRANSLYESILTGIPIGQAASYQQGFNPNGTTIQPDGTPVAPMSGAALGGAYGIAQNANGTPDYSAFFNSPDYQFVQQQGLKALDNAASYRSSQNTGQQSKAIQQFGQGLASTQYNNFMNRLAALGSQGQNAATGQANASQAIGSSVGSNYAQQGNNTANGIVGQANAKGNILGSIGQIAGLAQSGISALGGLGSVGAGIGSFFNGTGYGTGSDVYSAVNNPNNSSFF